MGEALYLIAILHLQLWAFPQMQEAVALQQESGYVAGWSNQK